MEKFRLRILLRCLGAILEVKARKTSKLHMSKVVWEYSIKVISLKLYVEISAAEKCSWYESITFGCH